MDEMKQKQDLGHAVPASNHAIGLKSAPRSIYYVHESVKRRFRVLATLLLDAHDAGTCSHHNS